MLDLDNAILIGEGEWHKDAAYRVYQQGDKYYAVLVVGHVNKEIDESTAVEITKSKISHFI